MIKTRGFTLIEVLVSMVILAIGLLGLAALQGISLRDNQDAYYYQQATLLSYEMQDRIRANGVYWKSSGIPTAAPISSCSTGCTAANMAKNDYQYWIDSAAKILPAPITNPTSIFTSTTTFPTTTSRVVVTTTAQNGTTANPVTTPCSTVTSPEICLITRWGRTNSKSTGKLSTDATFYLKVKP